MTTLAPPLEELERSATLTDKVVDIIIRSAADRKIPFGSRLVEADISKRLNISRVPVREALRLLASQGIVVNEPYKGTCLMPVDNDTLREVLVVRHAIEELAVRLAVGELLSGRGNTRGLRDALRSMESALQSKSASDLAASDVGFHREVLILSANKTLLSLWENMALKFQIIVGIAWHATDQQRIYQQHVELLKLFELGNLERILEFIKPHLFEGLEIGVPAAESTELLFPPTPRKRRTPAGKI
jgi:DNA-binding GntR family transcriptional regulator